VYDNFLSPERGRNAKVVWDVGGFIGSYALYSAHRADHVIVMEPGRFSYEALVQNIEVNPEVSYRLTAVNMALGGATGMVPMSNRGDAQDEIYMGPSEKKDWRNSKSKVQMITPDAMLIAFPALEHTEFIKIDTEGFEEFIIPALEPFLARIKPTLFLSLHPILVSSQRVLVEICERLMLIYPYLYEVTKSSQLLPLDVVRLRSYNFSTGGHKGADILGVWREIPKENRQMRFKGE